MNELVWDGGWIIYNLKKVRETNRNARDWAPGNEYKREKEFQ